MIRVKVVNRLRSRRGNSGSTVAEFGAAFYVFCLLILIPTINLLGFAVSMSFTHLTANVMADTVAQAMSPSRAQRILDNTATSLKSDPLAGLLKVSPATDPFKLELVGANTKGDVVVVMKRPWSEKAPANCWLQYRITANYMVKPIADLGSVPLINQIPVLGKETALSLTLTRAVEHAESVQQ